MTDNDIHKLAHSPRNGSILYEQTEHTLSLCADHATTNFISTNSIFKKKMPILRYVDRTYMHKTLVAYCAVLTAGNSIVN